MGESIRYDRALIRPDWEKTPEGYLRIGATFARTGLQRYRRQDGTEAVEYRPEEEVSKKDSLLSLANLPVTLEHPPELLTPETCREYQRGHTGSNVEYRTPFAYGVVTITDADAIRAIENGDAREVSVGYRVKFDATPGYTPDGERYDGIQREISGNHVAIVRKGRAGPEVRLHMDAACAIDPLDPLEGNKQPTTHQEESMTAVAALSNATEALAHALSAQVRADAGMTEAREGSEDEYDEEEMDEEDYEDEDEEEDEEDYEDEEEMDNASNLGSYKIAKKDGMVSKAMYDMACSERDDAIAAHERDLGRLDALMERLDSLEADLDARLDSEDVNIDELVNQRIELIDQATSILGERPTFDGLSDREIMVDTLVEAGVDPDRLEGKSDDYIAATFDAMASGGFGRLDSDPLAMALGSIPTDFGGQDAARQRMIERQKAAWQQPLNTNKGA